VLPALLLPVAAAAADAADAIAAAAGSAAVAAVAAVAAAVADSAAAVAAAHPIAAVAAAAAAPIAVPAAAARDIQLLPFCVGSRSRVLLLPAAEFGCCWLRQHSAAACLRQYMDIGSNRARQHSLSDHSSQIQRHV